ncbi:MAG: hypothetical protein IPJ41_07725 [Phycisphaerales bacterium]|nr:hypothetical protein [Phycisphaerales bacterium]
MRQHTGCLSLLVLCVATAGASADIARLGVFYGDASEGFESMADTNLFTPGAVFGGLATIEAPIVNITGSWSLTGEVLPHSGGSFAGGIGGPVRYEFTQPISAFGGYFSVASGIADGVASFYDASRALLGSDIITAPDPGPGAIAQWRWNGWQSDTPIAAIVLASNAPWGEHLMQDDMQVRTASRTIPSPSSASIAAAAALFVLTRPRGRPAT